MELPGRIAKFSLLLVAVLVQVSCHTGDADGPGTAQTPTHTPVAPTATLPRQTPTFTPTSELSTDNVVASPTPTPPDVFMPDIPERGFLMGILPVPGDEQSFEDVHKEASMYAEWVPIWGRPSPFYELANVLAGDWGQTFVKLYTEGNGMFPLVQVSFMGEGLTLRTPPDIETATLGDPAWRDAYKQAILDIVRVASPAYLSLGNEVNRWYEKYGADEDDSNGFQHYVTLYEEIYDAVKQASPNTRTFCIFAREIVSENREADLAVLDLFDREKMDLLVFTSYPHAVQGINRPSDIPSDYYSSALRYMPGKPLGFSELGWPSMPAFGDEKGQADFMLQAASRLTIGQEVELHLFGWSWLYDLDENDYVGLKKRDGSEKLAYQVWKNLASGKSPFIREVVIPYEVVKVTPETDLFLPVLHSNQWETPLPLEGPINTAGAEDSPFVTPDGDTFLFFFTPDVRVPPHEQLTDGVTGIWWSQKVEGVWTEPERITLSNDVSLNGCAFLQGDTLWFCSARPGNLGEVDIYTARYQEDGWTDWRNAGPQLNEEYDVGELHISADGNTMYFGWPSDKGFGGRDIWSSERSDGAWTEPLNLGPVVNSERDEDLPWLSMDGTELWFTGQSELGYTGPAIFRSVKLGDGEWGEPEEIISNFAGEPTLDGDGNIYFTHHFFDSDVDMLEADIYVAYRRDILPGQ